MRSRRLSPTLVTVALMGMCWSPLHGATATPEERDAQFSAVHALIEAELQGPAERQKADFQNAGYPDVAWYQKFLDWDFSDHFHDLAPDKVETLGKELSTAANDPASPMPDAVRKAYKGGGGTLMRLVNELAKIINPDDTPPPIGKDNIPAAEKQRRDYLVRDLISDSDQEWKDAAKVVKTFEDDQGPNGEANIWNMDEKDPKLKVASFAACNRRYQAVHILYLAHIVLREVITRGPDFGMDPAPVIAYYNDLLTQNREWLSKWDYDWGDEFLPLKSEVNIMLAEAIRVKVAQLTPEDIESELFKVLDADLRPFQNAIKAQMIDLQLTTWSSLLRWRLEMGGDHDLKHGLELWKDLLGRTKDLPVKLEDSDYSGQLLASCYIVAGRMEAANKNTSKASALFAEVAKYKDNRLSYDAKDWIANVSKGADPTISGWGSAPEPQDPGAVLGLAQALVMQARQTEDLVQQRSMYMNAAVALRNGILGLSDGYEDQMVDSGPALFQQYALVLSHLGMHYHAAIAAEAGLEAVSNAITDKYNPWRINHDPNRDLTEEGKAIDRLGRAALAFSSNLMLYNKDAGVQALYSQTITLKQKVAPTGNAKDLTKIVIQIKLSNGDYDGVINDARDFAHTNSKDLEDYFWAYDMITSARMAKFDALKKSPDQGSVQGDLDQIAADLNKSSAAIMALVKPIPKKTLSEKKAYATALSTPIFINYSQGHYDEVLAALDASFWATPPADENLRARMLRYLMQAIARKQDQSLKDPAAALNPQTLIDAFPQQQAAYETFQHQAPRIHDEDATATVESAAKTLANVFNTVDTKATEAYNADPKAALAPKLPPMIDYAKKALADLIFPSLSIKSPLGRLDAVAGLLWDMDDHVRAGHLYDLFTQRIAADNELQNFKRNPKGRLDQVETLVLVRPELKDDWAVIRDLLEDGPAVDDWRDGKVTRDQLTEKPIDYLDATGHLNAFLKRVDDMRTVLGEDDYKKITDALTELQKISYNLAQDILAKKRLALCYREEGKDELSQNLYNELTHYDPDDPDSKSALVDNVLHDIKAGTKVDNTLVDKARKIAISVREDSDKDAFAFWTSQIQIFELSAYLNDMDAINTALKWASLNGDISHDLTQPPIYKDAKIVGDDPRVRRAKNALAVDLANRFLKVYQFNGVTLKPTFTIQTVTVDGKDYTLFVDIGAPAMVGQSVENALGDQVVVFLPAGTPALVPESDTPAPAPATTPPGATSATPATPTTPGTAAPPAAVAPAPAQGATP